MGGQGDLLVSAFVGTVNEFMAVRKAVAETLKAGTNQQESTRIRMAEQLMEKGFIDSKAVLVTTNLQDFEGINAREENQDDAD